MHRVAVVGVEKNGVSNFVKEILKFEKTHDVKIESFIYHSKNYDLYDSIHEHGFKPSDFSAAISVGGDGTFLYTSRVFAGTDAAIFGINKGYLGFNTNIEEKEFDKYFIDLLEGRAEFEYRALLDIIIKGESSSYIVLNEGVISHTGISRMIKLKVNIGEQPLCNFSGDGLIVSSPTGSTAYNLSAGGPILHPSVNAYVLCPICPHTLAIRPYIIPFEENVEIEIEQSASQPQITLDGQKIILLEPGQKIQFRKSEKKVKIVKSSKKFSHILKTKLGWMV